MIKDLAKTKVHPVAELFPMMSVEEYEGLKEDIKANGQQEPVCYWRNELIDGRNRLQACQELGIKVDWWELSHDADPIPFIISKNLHRRHLSTGQRAMCAAQFANLSNGSNQHKTLVKSEKEGSQNCPPSGISIETASKRFDVGVGSAKSAKQIIASGSAEVKRAVNANKIKVSLAANLVNEVPSKAEQTKLIKQGTDAVKEAVTVPKKATKVVKAKDHPALSLEEQIKAERKKARSYAEYLQRSIDDLNRIKPNKVSHPELIKLCGKILGGLEKW